MQFFRLIEDILVFSGTKMSVLLHRKSSRFTLRNTQKIKIQSEQNADILSVRAGVI
jgi:hypothetical protein